MGRSEDVDRVLEALSSFAGSGEEHDYECTAFEEGQWCCLDPQHPSRPKIRAVVERALAEAPMS